MLITLDGIPPSKKNSKRIGRLRNGRPVLLSSENYLEWESNAVMIAKVQASNQTLDAPPLTLDIMVKVKDKRKRDADNIASSCMDMLVKAGIIKDDNLEIISELRVRWHESQSNMTYITLTRMADF